jgi:PAS domain S-box-containing protein
MRIRREGRAVRPRRRVASRLSRLALAAGIVLLAAEVVAAIALLTTSDHDTDPGLNIALAVTAGVAFVVSGLIALARRPENRTGIYLAAVGYLWFVGALQDADNRWVFVLGFVLGSVAFIPFAALLLAHPTGRFESRADAAFPWIVGAALVSLAAAALLVDRTPVTSCEGCPKNPVLVFDSPSLASVLQATDNGVGIALALVGVGLLVRRWRRARPALRRALWPVLVAGGGVLASLIVVGLVEQFVSKDVADAMWPLFLVFLAAVPAAFLFGVLRTRLARSAVSDVVIALQHGEPTRETLARALGDPTLEIVYRLPGGAQWVDAEGNGVAEPTSTPDRSVTLVERVGMPIAALEHDPVLEEERELVDAVTAAAGLSIHNERLTAEARAQYSLLETITDTAPSLLVNVDTEGRIVNQNQSAVDVAGLDEEEDVRGRYFWDVFIDPRERDDVIARFNALAPGFRSEEYENTFTNDRGEERVIYWRTAPVHGRDGSVSSIVAGGLDMTERHRLAAEKEREREFLNAIANLAPSLLCLIDHEGRVVDRAANISFEQRLGYATEETGGHIFWERYVAPEDADEVRGLIGRVVAGEEIGEHDHHWITRTGERRLVAWTCKALPRLDERRLFLLSGLDVTLRKQRELELQRERDFLSATANSIPTLLVLVDSHGVVSERGANDAFRRILGYEHDQIDGRVLWDVLATGADALALEVAFELSTSGAGPQRIESQWYTRDGDVRLVEWTTVSRLGADGGSQYLVCGNDVTERRHFEDEIIASRARIVRAEDEARRKLERNLHDGAQQRLVALSVSLRLVESKLQQDPAAASDLLTTSRDELTQALEELRELARGIHPAVLTDRGLRPALETLIGRAPVPVDLHVEIDGLTPDVEAAAYYVVAEALTNVAKYGQATSATVRVTELDGVLEVSVVDDGVGGADPEKGSGLRGLADRVEALAGRLEVESPGGSGTTIKAQIPLST